MTPPTDSLSRLRGSTHALVDLDAYAGNIGALRALMAPHMAFMAVVKADAYGHGALYCAQHALRSGVEWLGVARIHEGLRLRQVGLSAPILVLGPPNVREIDRARDRDLTITIGSPAMMDAVIAASRDANSPLRAHLKIDTGMRRFGVLPEQAPAIVDRLLRVPGLVLNGIFTHFACADASDQTTTGRQLEQFMKVVESLRPVWRPTWVHAANSAAVLSGQVAGTNLVRCGIASYGLSPSPEVPVGERFRQVLSIQSVIGHDFTLEAGEGVSYGHTYHATTAEYVATVPIGYGDGLPRQLSNQGWFCWHGQRCPIRGRVCMDQTIVALPPTARAGDPVTIIGAGAGEMTLDDVARLSGTINYEAATRITARVPRIYLVGGQPVAWEHLSAGDHGTC